MIENPLSLSFMLMSIFSIMFELKLSRLVITFSCQMYVYSYFSISSAKLDIKPELTLARLRRLVTVTTAEAAGIVCITVTVAVIRVWQFRCMVNDVW